jgi:hypothetical protein
VCRPGRAHIGPLTGEVQDKLAVFGSGGPFTHALPAVNIALWRIAGKAAGARSTASLAEAATIWPATRAWTPVQTPTWSAPPSGKGPDVSRLDAAFLTRPHADHTGDVAAMFLTCGAAGPAPASASGVGALGRRTPGRTLAASADQDRSHDTHAR